MLRTFASGSNQTLVQAILEEFRLEPYKHLTIISFESLSPDSFMWRLLLDDTVYYLYAEDYVPGLEYINGVFDKLIGQPNWELIAAKRRKSFESASPVTRASTYKKATDADDMMAYAVPSGYDFVFLAKSSEDPNEIDCVILPHNQS